MIQNDHDDIHQMFEKDTNKKPNVFKLSMFHTINFFSRNGYLSMFFSFCFKNSFASLTISAKFSGSSSIFVW